MRFLPRVLFTVVVPVLGAVSFAPGVSVVDVTQPPYLAKAEGVTDDNKALQRAINENTSTIGQGDGHTTPYSGRTPKRE